MSLGGPALDSQSGYTIVEMLTVLAILGTIMGGLTAVFVQGTKSETDLNNRFGAQQQARLAIAAMRSDGHRACDVKLTGSSSALFYYWDTAPPNGQSEQCADSETSPAWSDSSCTTTLCLTWCTRSSNGRYGLYRVPGSATCGTTGGTLKADYLTTGNIFSFTAGSTSGVNAHDLAVIALDIPVNTHTANSHDKYELKDFVVLRNDQRG